MKISKTMYNRLNAQAEEAKHLKLTKTASNLDYILSEADVRDDDVLYSYSKENLEKNIQRLLWKIAMNTFDYFDKAPDADQVQVLINTYAGQLFNDLRVLTGSDDGVGKFEPIIPGEDIEISDD